MSKFVDRCKKELDMIIDECNEDAKEMQEYISKQIMEVIEVVDTQDHSGLSIVYLTSTLSRLLDSKPLKPLTGKEDEWGEEFKDSNGNIMQQNKRYGSVFRFNKDNSTAVNSEGKIFSRDGESWFSNKESSIPIEFPYAVPDKPEKILLIEEE